MDLDALLMGTAVERLAPVHARVVEVASAQREVVHRAAALNRVRRVIVNISELYRVMTPGEENALAEPATMGLVAGNFTIVVDMEVAQRDVLRPRRHGHARAIVSKDLDAVPAHAVNHDPLRVRHVNIGFAAAAAGASTAAARWQRLAIAAKDFNLPVRADGDRRVFRPAL